MQKLIRISQLCSLLSVSRSTVYRWIKEKPDFPKPIKLTEWVTVFDRGEIEAWISNRRKA
ncbi:AlpA family phage regulatory protein [uncultured Parasutterella sp.]|uniref:helix-turn-helix transcriptional regulator n=1 Tax=Parasutterella excrementihominis TaxID=487175 RepID=UPI003427A038